MVSGHLAVKKNRWYAILCLRHPDGRRYDKWIATGLSYPGNKRKAEAMLIELRRQHFNSHIWNAATLLSEYIPDWLKTRQKEISETTYSSYLQIANEIVRYFLNQDVRLSQISPHHIETYYQTLYERGLKSNSVLHHHALLHKALADASRKGLIAENPMEKVQRPAKGSYIPHPYTAEEMKTLFAALQGHYMEVPIKLAAYYGLRRSEVLGLRWQAIDFEQETISVEHTICEVSQAVSNQKIIGRDTVKQKSSNRTLPMTPNIKALLLEYRGKHRQQNEHTATDYLFTDDSGNVIRPGHISNPVLVKKDREFCIKNMALFKRFANTDISMRYVYWFLFYAQYKLKKEASGGVQSFISLSRFREYLIPLPPVAEQNRIVAKLEEILPLCERLK